MHERSLFVYGTLRKAFAHPLSLFIEKNSVFAGTGTVRGNLYDLGEYPGAVPAKTNLVWGEVYVLNKNISQRVLAKLDEYEGYLKNEKNKSLFAREWITVKLTNEQTTEAWMYWYQHPVDEATRIASGDYVAHRLAN